MTFLVCRGEVKTHQKLTTKVTKKYRKIYINRRNKNKIYHQKEKKVFLRLLYANRLYSENICFTLLHLCNKYDLCIFFN